MCLTSRKVIKGCNEAFSGLCVVTDVKSKRLNWKIPGCHFGISSQAKVSQYKRRHNVRSSRESLRTSLSKVETKLIEVLTQ